MPKDLFSVKNKVVIITGGAGLLGLEFSRTLSKAGAKVFIFDVLDQKVLESRAKKAGAIGLKIDITNESDVKRAVASIAKVHGTIDVLINNAALNPAPNDPASKDQWLPYEKYPISLWEKEIAVGLTGTLIMTQAVTPFMKRAKSGSIINISSIYGLTAPDHRIYEKGKFKSIAYATIKSGIYNFTRSWASYLGGSGVRVNTLTFGGVHAGQSNDFVSKYAGKTMLGRMAEKDEYNGAILFLSSDASSYVTGANIVIDGGWSAW